MPRATGRGLLEMLYLERAVGDARPGHRDSLGTSSPGKARRVGSELGSSSLHSFPTADYVVTCSGFRGLLQGPAWAFSGRLACATMLPRFSVLGCVWLGCITAP